VASEMGMRHGAKGERPKRQVSGIGFQVPGERFE